LTIWIILLLFLGLVNPVNQSIQRNHTASNANDQFTWIEQHSATVSALGIISTFILFIVQRWIQSTDENKTFLTQKESYLYDLADELGSIGLLMKSTRISESRIQIFDLAFPSDAYDKVPLETLHLEQASLATIRDYYYTLNLRNKLYFHRIEVKHNFFTPTGISTGSWCNFISELDKKINQHEEFLIESYDEVSDTVEKNLSHTRSTSRSLRTRIGFLPKRF
jgi:hypothetical protein